MNYVLVFLLCVSLFYYKRQGFTTEFSRANSYDISQYASNTYPCVNENKQEQHSQP